MMPPKDKTEKRIFIEGMKTVLTKIYCKLDPETALYILAEANDIPGLNGCFFVDADLIVHFKSRNKNKKKL